MIGQDTRYTYATGRVRVLESRLLNRQAFERIIESQAISEAIFILKEYGLSPFLNENLTIAYKVLDELSLDREVPVAFRIKYDLYNLKTILRSKIINTKADTLSKLGVLGPDLIRKMANKERLTSVPFDYIPLIQRTEGLDLRLLNFIFDKYMANYMLAIFERYDFLKDYFKRYIDLKNLDFYFRLKEKTAILKDALLDGGYLNRAQFLRGFDVKEARQYDMITTPGLEHYAREGSLSLFEKLCDDYLLNFLKPAKYMPFGIEPLFSYVIALEYQARSIDMILFSKKNEIPKDAIRKNLRESYV